MIQLLFLDTQNVRGSLRSSKKVDLWMNSDSSMHACALNLDERRSRCDAVAVVGLLCIPLEKDSIGACGFAPACSFRSNR